MDANDSWRNLDKYSSKISECEINTEKNDQREKEKSSKKGQFV